METAGGDRLIGRIVATHALNLRVERARRRGQQTAIARAIGAHQTQLSAWESGARPVPDEFKIRLARYYGMPVHVLFPLDVDDLDDRFPPAADASNDLTEEDTRCADERPGPDAATDRPDPTPTDDDTCATDGAPEPVA